MDTPATQMAESMTAISETLASVTSAVTGHKAQLEQQGLSTTAAEQCAVQYHAMLMALIMRAK